MNKANAKLTNKLNKATSELDSLISQFERMGISNKRKRPASNFVQSIKKRRLESAPVSYASQVTRSDGMCTLRGTEPVGELVVGNNTFDVVGNIRFQPGSSSAFPWLSGIAQRYEKYKFRSIRVRYTPACATTTVGTVIFGFDYDVKDALPTTITQAAQYYSKRTSPYKDLTWDIALKDNRFLYTCDLVPSGTDPKTYDYGRLIVSTFGVPANTTIGFLELDYVIDFQSTNPVNNIGNPLPNVNCPSTILSNASNITVGTTAVGLNSGNLSVVKRNGVTQDTDFITLNNQGVKFNQPGTYLVQINCSKFTGAAADEYAIVCYYTSSGNNIFVLSGTGVVMDANVNYKNGLSVSGIVIIDENDVGTQYYFNATASANSKTINNTGLNIAFTKLY